MHTKIFVYYIQLDINKQETLRIKKIYITLDNQEELIIIPK